MKKCTNCNQTYPDNMKFCSNCGTALIEINETNSQAQTGYYTQNNNGTFNAQQNYNPNSDMNYSQNGGNAYNPSNSYSTGTPNQNNVAEGGFMPWLPLILAIAGLILDSIIVGLLLSIGAFVLLKMGNHIYKYPTAVKILSIAGVIVGIVAGFAYA